MALVTMIVRARIAGLDREIVEASSDLYATPFGTFRQIVLPQILPSILAGFLLAFTFSFDDFIIAFFVAGAHRHPANLRLLLDPPRRHPGDQRNCARWSLPSSLILIGIAQVLDARQEEKE